MHASAELTCDIFESVNDDADFNRTPIRTAAKRAAESSGHAMVLAVVLVVVAASVPLGGMGAVGT